MVDVSQSEKKSSSAPNEKSFISETFQFDRLVFSDSYLSCFSMQVTGRSFFLFYVTNIISVKKRSLLLEKT